MTAAGGTTTRTTATTWVAAVAGRTTWRPRSRSLSGGSWVEAPAGEEGGAAVEASAPGLGLDWGKGACRPCGPFPQHKTSVQYTHFFSKRGEESGLSRLGPRSCLFSRCHVCQKEKAWCRFFSPGRVCSFPPATSTLSDDKTVTARGCDWAGGGEARG